MRACLVSARERVTTVINNKSISKLYLSQKLCITHTSYTRSATTITRARTPIIFYIYTLTHPSILDIQIYICINVQEITLSGRGALHLPRLARELLRTGTNTLRSH